LFLNIEQTANPLFPTNPLRPPFNVISKFNNIVVYWNAGDHISIKNYLGAVDWFTNLQKGDIQFISPYLIIVSISFNFI